MIGRGALRELTTNLPSRTARLFSESLFVRCGCRLAYQRARLVYVAYRPGSPHRYPRTYLDVGTAEVPLRMSTLTQVSDYVRLADSQMDGDLDKFFDVAQRRWKYDEDQREEAYLDDLIPELHKDLKRIHEIATDGRYYPKHHIVAA